MPRGRKPKIGKAMTAAERQRRHRLAGTLKALRGPTYVDDPRRSQPVSITWTGALRGLITIDSECWGAVEWSHKLQCWCIEDNLGACLAHQASIHGAAASKEAAIALATEMVRDGRMPSPQEARRLHRLPEPIELPELPEPTEAEKAETERLRAAREKRARQPAQIRKAEERQRLRDASMAASYAEWNAKEADRGQAPLLEVFAESFDFTDPDLWKSNSWAMIRPRLVIHQRAVVAKLQSELASASERASKTPFEYYRDNEERKRAREQRQHWGAKKVAHLQQQLDRAQEVLAALEGRAEPMAAAAE